MSDAEFYNYLNSLDSSSYSSAASTAEGAGVWGLIALILAIIGGILVYFLFVKPKTAPKGKFAKWLKDFLAFKTMWLEPILKVVYYVLTIFVILYSFTFLGMFGVFGGVAFLYFLIWLVLGPVLLRLGYEMTMMFIMIWRNTENISENTEKKK